MTGWIVLAAVWALGVVVVFRASNDPMHRLLAPIWPLTVIYLLLTINRN